MNFTTKKVNTQTLGEYLQSSRAYLGLSIAEIARLAKIQPKYLTALENGEYADLPSAVYVRGFLKSLSQIYRISTANLLAQYESEKGIQENIEISHPRPAVASAGQFVLSPKTLTVLVVAAAGLASLSYLYIQVSSLHRPPRLEVFSPETDGTADSHLIVVAGRTEAGAGVFINNQPIVVDVDGNFRENLSLAPGTNQLAIKSVNKFDKETVVLRAIAVTDKQIAGVQDSATTTAEVSPPAGGLEVEIRIGPGSSWVNLQIDGEEEYAGTMLAGSSRKIQAHTRVILSTGNAGSTRIYMNGRDLGILGKDGETLRDVEFSK